MQLPNKCVLQEKLHENPTTGQIVINGLSFPVLKALIEYMYCGEATVLKDQYKQLIGAAAFFQIIGLEIIKDGSQVSGGSIGNIKLIRFVPYQICHQMLFHR